MVRARVSSPLSAAGGLVDISLQGSAPAGPHAGSHRRRIEVVWVFEHACANRLTKIEYAIVHRRVDLVVLSVNQRTTGRSCRWGKCAPPRFAKVSLIGQLRQLFNPKEQDVSLALVYIESYRLHSHLTLIHLTGDY
jgi:hypothetical protein